MKKNRVLLFFILLAALVSLGNNQARAAEYKACNIGADPVNPNRTVEWPTEMETDVTEPILVTIATGSGKPVKCYFTGRAVKNRETGCLLWARKCGNDFLDGPLCPEPPSFSLKKVCVGRECDLESFRFFYDDRQILPNTTYTNIKVGWHSVTEAAPTRHYTNGSWSVSRQGCDFEAALEEHYECVITNTWVPAPPPEAVPPPDDDNAPPLKAIGFWGPQVSGSVAQGASGDVNYGVVDPHFAIDGDMTLRLGVGGYYETPSGYRFSLQALYSRVDFDVDWDSALMPPYGATAISVDGLDDDRWGLQAGWQARQYYAWAFPVVSVFFVQGADGHLRWTECEKPISMRVEEGTRKGIGLGASYERWSSYGRSLIQLLYSKSDGEVTWDEKPWYMITDPATRWDGSTWEVMYTYQW